MLALSLILAQQAVTKHGWWPYPHVPVFVQYSGVRLAAKDYPLQKFVEDLFRGRKYDVVFREPLGNAPVTWNTYGRFIPFDSVLKRLTDEQGVVFEPDRERKTLYRIMLKRSYPLADPGVRLVKDGNFYFAKVKNAPLSSVIERWNELAEPTEHAQLNVPGLSLEGLDLISANPKDLLWDIARAAKLDVTTKDGVYQLNAKEPEPKPKQASWQLTFVGEENDATKVRSAVFGSDDKSAYTSENSAEMSSAVRIARFLHAASKGKLITGADRNVIEMEGSDDDVRRARTMLAQTIDIPYSQVRVDAWTIQVNTENLSALGSPQQRTERAQDNLEDIRAGMAITKDLTYRLNNALADYVRSRRFDIEATLNQTYRGPVGSSPALTLRDVLVDSGFNVSSNRPLTMAESMVLLGLRLGPGANTQSELAYALGKAGDDYLAGVEQDLNALAASAPPDDRATRRRVTRLQDLVAGLKAKLRFTSRGSSAFPHFLPAFADAGAPVIQQGIGDFFFYWAASANKERYDVYLRRDKKNEPLEDVPILLSQSAAGADSMLKAAVGGFSDDVQSLTVQPLMAWIRSTVQEGNARKSGIDLVGKTSMVVSSRLPASTIASAQASYPFLPRPKLSLDDIKANPKDTSLADTLIAGLTPTELIAVKALFNEPDVKYDTVAPGVSLKIRPQVLRDGGSARLAINLKTTMDVTPPTGGGTDPLDVVKGHEMTTDLAVQALDLLEVSTFGMEHTGLGDPSWRIPVLEQLPVLGPIFRGPRTRVTKHQESMVILSVTVLPKSLDLAGRFIR
jgi:hypothetical protein